MSGAPLALAFTAGMVATFNPCGFSLLPAYVSAFVAGDDASDRMDRRIIRSIGVAAAMSVGFVLVFTIAGLGIEALTGQIRRQLPWVTIGIGVLLLAAGVAMVAGWKPTVAIPMLKLRSRRSRHGTMVVYGATFAVASLSCTIGPFLAVTGTSLTRSSAEGVATYVAYGVGMGTIILAISIASAFTHSTFVGRMRRIATGMSRVGGALMILAGAYIIWYARWELSVLNGGSGTDPLVDAGEDVRMWFVDLIDEVGAGPLALIIAAAVGVGIWATRTATQARISDPAFSGAEEQPAGVGRKP